MIGTLAINLVVGTVAFVVTFFTALSGNVWLVSLERAVYALFFFFLAAFPLRWLISVTVTNKKSEQAEETGTHVDLVTPPDLEANLPAQTASEPAETFTPLNITRNERTNVEKDPANIANVVRRLTDE